MPHIQRFGDYFLLKKIATGGMAELWKAKKSGEEGFEKLLAIKMILPHLSQNEEFISMFVDEAKVAALLNHQNIVQIYDLGKIEGSYCIVMEYIRGKDLKAVLHRAGHASQRLKVEHACHIAASTLAGLSYAHRKKDRGRDLNIVHRDISPPNILVSYEGEVKIGDFGIAKAATQSRDTKVGILKGKIAYMSPEQATGRPLDLRSDIFSAGVVLYEMLTGKKLFQGDTDFNTLEKVREAKVEPLPSELNKEIPKELEEIVLQALAREPEGRFQSAAEMEEALLSFMRNSGFTASGYSLSHYMHKLFRDDIEEELAEEGGWDKTVVTPKPPKPTAPAAPAPRPKPEVRARPAARAPVSARKTVTPLWQKLLLVFLLLSAGGIVWYGIYSSRPRYMLELLPPAKQQTTQPAVAPQPATAQAPPTFAPATSGLPRPVSAAPAAKPAPPPPEKPAAAPAAKPARAAKRPAPEPAPQERVFRLTVGSSPAGARILLDGSDTGRRTPAVIDGLRPDGRYTVRLALDGFAPYEQTVAPQGAARMDVSASLVQQFGSFNINSKPWFFVTIDGEDKGITPLAGMRLAAGEHTMVLQNPKLNITRQVTLRIAPDKTTSIVIDPASSPMLKEIIR